MNNENNVEVNENNDLNTTDDELTPFMQEQENTSVEEPKTLHNSDVKGAKENVSDLEVYGDGDSFQLLCKASSRNEGWMKSTKAMQTPTGCVVQVTTQQGDHVAEALTFVPGVGVSPAKGQPAPNGRTLVPLKR